MRDPVFSETYNFRVKKQTCKYMRKCCRCDDEYFCYFLCRKQHKGSRGYLLWGWRGIWEISWRRCLLILEGEGFSEADKRQGDKDTSGRRKYMNIKVEVQRTTVSGSEWHYWNGLWEGKRHIKKDETTFVFTTLLRFRPITTLQSILPLF